MEANAPVGGDMEEFLASLARLLRLFIQIENPMSGFLYDAERENDLMPSCQRRGHQHSLMDAQRW